MHLAGFRLLGRQDISNFDHPIQARILEQSSKIESYVLKRQTFALTGKLQVTVDSITQIRVRSGVDWPDVGNPHFLILAFGSKVI
ncbi:MAG: hypothetical protein Aurels2KO_33040 [Aureliella sp.]